MNTLQLFEKHVRDLNMYLFNSGSEDIWPELIMNERKSSVFSLYALVDDSALQELFARMKSGDKNAEMFLRDLYALLNEMGYRFREQEDLSKSLRSRLNYHCGMSALLSSGTKPSRRLQTLHKMFEDVYLECRHSARVKLDGEDEYVESLLSGLDFDKVLNVNRVTEKS